MPAIDFPPLRTRLMVYDPDGTLRGQLPAPMTWSAAFPHNDLSSMTLEYVSGAPGAAMLMAPCEVALEIAGVNGTFTEPPDCRFINIRMTQDLTQPDVTIKLTMPSYGWMLNKALNIVFADFNDNGNRPFNTYPGSIIKTFIDDAHSRGNIPFLDYDFSAIEDSDGQNWVNTLNVAITAGQSIYATLTTFAGQGLFDWRMNKRTLQLYLVDTFLNRDLTNNPTAVKLQPARDISAAPDDLTYEDIVKRVLMQGDDNTFVVQQAFFNPSPWGDWEGFMTQSGVKDTHVMTQLAQSFLETGSGRRTQITREIVFSYNSPLPLLDYRAGDHILAKDETGVFDNLRVQQITLTNNGVLTGNVVLGDMFTERDIRFQRRLAALSGGSNTIGGSGSVPSTPAIPVDDTRVPKQVENVGVGYTTSIDAVGNPTGTIQITWDAVTEATDDSIQDIDNYRVQWTKTGTGPTGQRTVDAINLQTQIGEGIQVFQTYDVQVAAIGSNGRQGAWSDVATIFVGPDETPPSVPSTPVITGRLGTLRVHWDGRDEDGLNMPIDTAVIEVEIATAESGPYTFIGTIASSATDLIVTDLTYDVPVFFRLRAKDTSGNYGDYSAVATGTPVKTGADDIVAHSITSDLIEVGSIDAESLKAYSIDATRLAVGGQRNLISDPNFADSVLSNIRLTNANKSVNTASPAAWTYQNNSFFRLKLASNATGTTARLGFFTSSVIDPNLASGSTIAPALLYPVDRSIGSLASRLGVSISLSSGTWPAGASVEVDLFVRWYLKDGTGGTSINSIAVTYSAVTAGFVNLNGTALTIPTDAVAFIPYVRVVFTSGTPTIQVDISTPFVAQASTGVLIEDGAITANKIVANAITATQLDAVAITAKHTITGAVFQTGTSGTRVIISPNANYLNQPGINLTGGSGGGSTSIFQADAAGSGGWIPYSYVVVGPSGVPSNANGPRADINLRPGGSFAMGKANVNNNGVFATVESGSTGNELSLAGTVPRGTEMNDAYGTWRIFSTSVTSGSLTWGLNNGWTYQGVVAPNAGSATTLRYANVVAAGASIVTWQSSGAADLVYCMFYRGGYLY